MIWRLIHWARGTHYAICNPFEGSTKHIITKVRHDGDGRPYLWVNGRYCGLIEMNPDRWHPLTFSRKEIENIRRNRDGIRR